MEIEGRAKKRSKYIYDNMEGASLVFWTLRGHQLPLVMSLSSSENVKLLVSSEMFQDKIITQNLIQSRFQITLTPNFLQKPISENACNSSSLSGLFRAHCFNRDRGLFCKSAFRK